jgi:RHS repeat-associated protein
MEYDILGRLTSLTYPDGQSVSNVYSEMGYLAAVLKGGTDSAFVQYGKDPGTISAANNVLGTVNSAYDRRAVRRTGNGIMTVIGYEPVTHHPTDVITQNVSATEGDMVGYIYEQTKYTYDLNDNVSKIAYDKYMNADDTSLTQSFTYDGLNRIISANGSYGSKTYEYNHFGNLTKKGEINLTYGDSAHPHAVTGTSTGKTYTYDSNGNMTNRNGQILTYDSYDQLRRVETSGKPTEQYTYDHTGTRVKKTRSDGVIVYNIGGLYELAIVPGRSQMHTKYIMGWNGEMVAQTTRDDATLIGALAPNPLIDIRYSPNHTLKIIGEICWMIMRPDREFGIYGRYIPRGLIMLGFILLVIGIYYRTVRRKEGERHHRLTADLAPVILCAFVAFSGTLSCGDILGPYNDMEYDDSGDDNYDPGSVDTTGFPEKGTYYFHPNQVGSAQFVTDSAGRVTYKTAYTPYGEKIADKTEGKKVTHFGYTDQEEDDNTGLVYYGARYYDPEIARFIQADTMVPDPTSSQDFNRYMYCLGNPIRYNDPTGNYTSAGAPGPSGGIGGLSGMAGPSNSYGGSSGSGKSKTTESQLNNLDDNNGALAFARSKHPGFFKDEKGDGEDGPTANKKGQEGDPEKGDGGKKGGNETPKGDPGGVRGGGGNGGDGGKTHHIVTREEAIAWNKEHDTTEGIEAGELGPLDILFGFGKSGFKLLRKGIVVAWEEGPIILGKIIKKGTVKEGPKLLSGPVDLTIKVFKRKSLGRDGGQSVISIFYKDGKAIGRLHQVVDENGKIIHQHLTSIGESGFERLFPSEWTGIPVIK